MKKKIFISIVFSSVIIFVTACTNNNNDSTSTKESTQAKSEAYFDYDNQKNWEYVSGKMQSPIDIPASLAKKMEDKGTIKLDYSSNITQTENNGHTIQVTNSGTAVINGRKFNLAQFHFHAKSEHTIDGKHYPLEAHFVNKAQDGRIAVIAVFFVEGTENKGFKEVLDDVTDGKKTEILDIEAMLPKNLSYYHYLGSLTTPPLIENVEWYVLKTPVQISKEQIKTFNKFYNHNNRKTQPLNERVILEYNE